MNALHSFYDALIGSGVAHDKARAVVEAFEMEMTSVLATKADIDHRFESVQSRLDQRFVELQTQMDKRSSSVELQLALLRKDMEIGFERLRTSMLLRMGAMQIATTAVLFAALKLT